MEKQWTKKGLRLTTIDADAVDGHRSFSSIGKDVDDQKIIDFSKIVEKLTGDDVKFIAVTEVNQIAE